MMVLNPADLPTLNITPSLPHCQNVAMPSSMWHVKSLLEPQGTELGIKKGRLFRERKQVSRSILTWSGSPLLQKVTEHVQEKPRRGEEGSLSVGFFFYMKSIYSWGHTQLIIAKILADTLYQKFSVYQALAKCFVSITYHHPSQPS